MTPPPRAHTSGRVRRAVWIAAAVLAAALVLGVGAFVAWGLTPLGPSATARSAMHSGAGVTVTSYDWGVLFTREGAPPRTGLVLYPGGHVDYRSYAPLAREIAAQGGSVALLKLPLSLAVLAPDAAAGPLRDVAGVDSWVVGGHSLGGVMAARYALTDERVRGVLLLASYPIDDLSGTGLAVTDVRGSEDAVLDLAAWREAQPLLPKDATHLVIEGGNHAQFGDYGAQPGDGPAATSPEAQRVQTARAALDLLESISR